jgi:hypothetical protein
MEGLEAANRLRWAFTAAEIEADRYFWRRNEPEAVHRALARAQEVSSDDRLAATRTAVLLARHDYAQALQAETAEERQVQAPPIRAALEAAKDAFQAAGDRRATAWATFYLGTIADNLERDRFDPAAPREAAALAFREAHGMAEVLGDDELLGETTRHLSVDSHRRGEVEETLQLAERSLQLFERAGTLPAAAAARLLLAQRLSGAGREPQRVAELIEQSLVVARALELPGLGTTAGAAQSTRP